jgi:hypothetical protein
VALRVGMLFGTVYGLPSLNSGQGCKRWRNV